METINCKICSFVNEADAAVCRRCGTPFRDTPEASSSHHDDTTRDKTMADLKIRRGQVIAKRYVVQEIVGRGGMGRIFKVHDNTLDEDVALKMLLPE